MCLFTFPNQKSIKARQKGIERFTCGACPECLQKKSRLWALRCSMEAKVSQGVMVTLTYDTYKVNYGKETFEENPTDPTIPLSKRDCQLFIKRLRKHFTGKHIKYLLTAERGKRTGRAHYHALLFNVSFPDLVKYKKSDRGNWIYKSKTLEKIWQKGICTVDCVNLSAKTARYCTKYCSKDAGIDDTFMLFSRGIGEEMLLKKFNGKSYWIDGREYSIPKQVWQKYIETKYNLLGYSRYSPTQKLYDTEKSIDNRLNLYERKRIKINAFLPFALDRLEKHKNKLRKFRKDTTAKNYYRLLFKYQYRVNNLERAWKDNEYLLDSTVKRKVNSLLLTNVSHERGRVRNETYQAYRDGDVLYKRYLAYWNRKAKAYEQTQLPEEERLLALPDNKYRAYKTKAILCKQKQLHNKQNRFLQKSFIPPRSNCHAFDPFATKEEYVEKSFAPLSRHYRANDTIKTRFSKEFRDLRSIRYHLLVTLPTRKQQQATKY